MNKIQSSLVRASINLGGYFIMPISVIVWLIGIAIATVLNSTLGLGWQFVLLFPFPAILSMIVLWIILELTYCWAVKKLKRAFEIEKSYLITNRKSFHKHEFEIRTAVMNQLKEKAKQIQLKLKEADKIANLKQMKKDKKRINKKFFKLWEIARVFGMPVYGSKSLKAHAEDQRWW